MKENALPDIENYMFEDHDKIRQAATECMCNLVTCKEVRRDKQLKPNKMTDEHSQYLQLLSNRCGCIEDFNCVCFRSKSDFWKMAMTG